VPVVICTWCGKSTKRSASRIRSGPMFCNRACRTAHRRNAMVSPYKEICVGGVRIFEHRAIMEKKLGRKLGKNEIVHHKDGDGHNNSPKNLLLVSRKTHAKEHMNEKTKKILQLAKTGYTTREIAAALSVSYASVWKTLDWRGIKAKKSTTRLLHWNVDTAVQMLKDGLSMRATARKLGVSHMTISHVLRRRGIEPVEYIRNAHQ
jgi:DNA-binding CsgD family transcriptional regulator